MLWRAHIFMVPGEKKLRQISTQFVRGSTFHTSTIRNHSQFYIEFLQSTQVHLCIFHLCIMRLLEKLSRIEFSQSAHEILFNILFNRCENLVMKLSACEV